jgi:pimeloyl-ACP methyl ester carboxylesterase
VLEETQDTEELIERVAALAIGKAELVCCVRVPGEGKRGRRLQELRTYTTMTRSLLVYGDKDVRAPLAVAEDLHAAIPGSTLVVLSDAGHICNIEAPEAFNRTVRSFLRGRRS